MYLVRSLASLGLVLSLCISQAAGGSPKFCTTALPMIGSPFSQEKSQKAQTPNSGNLNITDATGRNLGQCPLKHTAVDANISGYVSRVTVEQTFTNPYPETIEAIYTFPLSDQGAVNEMVMKIGARTIRGTIKTREDARHTYETAKRQGRIASLLDQERTNIFTQSVANIPPNETVKIEIKYVEYLSFENGHYKFAFPMVVGPRYIPGKPTGHSGTGFAPNTEQVPDASKITPPVVAETTRAGHDISMHVSLDAGVSIQSLESVLHKVNVQKNGNKAEISLANGETIPNRDFVLDWKVSTDAIRPGYIAHKTDGIGFFTVMLLPPERPTPEQICPRELNFIVDRSGSQSGLPIQKAKETMLYIIDRLNKEDTFQVFSFSNGTEQCFEKPMSVSNDNVAKAKKYIAQLEANGGTEMRDAVETATAGPAPDHKLRIFVLMTDGYIGNDQEIIGLVKRKRCLSRWFTFGTGNSVNRMLIDGVAKAGGGEPDYVYLNTPGDEVAKKFFEKISSPVLSDVTVEFQGVDVADVQPTRINDLWAQRPLYITGKYISPGSGSVTIHGFSGGKPYSSTLPLNLPAQEQVNAVLPAVWARGRVDDLMQLVCTGISNALTTQATSLVEKMGLFYHLLTNFTSFVAVDDSQIRQEPTKNTVTVGVETPDGVSLQKIFPGSNAGHRQKDRVSLKLPKGTPMVYGLQIDPKQVIKTPTAAAMSLQASRDVNMFQVEPTVIDQRMYSSGRAERSQFSGVSAGASLGLGSPSFMKAGSSVSKYTPIKSGWSGTAIGASAGVASTLKSKQARPLSNEFVKTPVHPVLSEPYENKFAHANLSLELQARLAEVDENSRLLLRLKADAIDPHFLARLKEVQGVRIIETHEIDKVLVICASAYEVLKLAHVKGVALISSSEK